MGIHDRVSMLTDKIKALLDEFEIDGVTLVAVREDEVQIATIAADGSDCWDYLVGIAKHLQRTEFCPDCGSPLVAEVDIDIDADNDNPSTLH